MSLTACVPRMTRPRHEFTRVRKMSLTLDGVRNATVASECRFLDRFNGER